VLYILDGVYVTARVVEVVLGHRLTVVLVLISHSRLYRFLKAGTLLMKVVKGLIFLSESVGQSADKTFFHGRELFELSLVLPLFNLMIRGFVLISPLN
jgi:hypothetical protein